MNPELFLGRGFREICERVAALELGILDDA